MINVQNPLKFPEPACSQCKSAKLEITILLPELAATISCRLVKKLSQLGLVKFPYEIHGSGPFR